MLPANSPLPRACPYLGKREDPASRHSYANEEHHCFRTSTARRVSRNHQERFCLSEDFYTCPVYLGGEKPRDPNSRPLGLGMVALSMIVLAVVLSVAAFMIATLIDEGDSGGRTRSTVGGQADQTLVPEETAEEIAEQSVSETPRVQSTPVRTATEEPEPSVQTYVVQPGDNVTEIAREHGVDPLEIIDLNGLDAAGDIEVGQTLLIPN